MTDLPNGWEIKRLDEIADIVMGQSPPGSSYNEHGEGRPFFQGKTEFGEVHPTVRKYTTAGTKFAKAGDILMSVRAPVGPTNIADIDCVIGRGLAAIRAKTVVSQDYLRWSLKHLEIDIQSKGTGTTFDAITGETLRGTLVALPPIPEQQKIVEILEDHLSRLDAALADVKQAKLKAAQFRRSLLKSTFEEFSENSVRIGEVVTFNRKKPVELKNSKTEVSFVPMPKVSEVSGQISLDEHISHSEGQRRSLTYFENGDVIFAKITPCMENGKIALAKNLLNGAAYGSTEFHVLTPTERILPDYLRYFIGSDDFRANAERAMTGAVGQRRVPKTYLDQHEIPLPTIDIQVGIVANLDEALSRTDEAVKAAEQIDKEAARLRRSLLQAAFTGQLTEEVASV